MKDMETLLFEKRKEIVELKRISEKIIRNKETRYTQFDVKMETKQRNFNGFV